MHPHELETHDKVWTPNLVTKNVDSQLLQIKSLQGLTFPNCRQTNWKTTTVSVRKKKR